MIGHLFRIEVVTPFSYSAVSRCSNYHFRNKSIGSTTKQGWGRIGWVERSIQVALRRQSTFRRVDDPVIFLFFAPIQGENYSICENDHVSFFVVSCQKNIPSGVPETTRETLAAQALRGLLLPWKYWSNFLQRLWCYSTGTQYSIHRTCVPPYEITIHTADKRKNHL